MVKEIRLVFIMKNMKVILRMDYFIDMEKQLHQMGLKFRLVNLKMVSLMAR
jgi:hypothetical protein